MWRNAGALSNEGIEVDIKYDIMRTDNSFWTISVNFAKNWNKLLETYNGKDMNMSDMIGNSRSYIIGKPVGNIMGYKTCLLYTSNPRISPPPNIFPEAIHKAEIGIINIPQVIENKADFLRISEVTKFTVNTTTKGFTLAYQPMALASPAKRVKMCIRDRAYSSKLQPFPK